MGIEGLSDVQTNALTGINVVCSLLSFVGSLFIVITYLCFKDLRKFSFRLIFFLSFSDMMCSLFNILGNPGEGPLCYLQGYATQFFWVASFLWTTTIAYTLHSTVVRHKTSVVSLGPLFHLFVWGTAFFMTVIPLLGNDYGPAGAWCWVQNETLMGKVVRGTMAQERRAGEEGPKKLPPETKAQEKESQDDALDLNKLEMQNWDEALEKRQREQVSVEDRGLKGKGEES